MADAAAASRPARRVLVPPVTGPLTRPAAGPVRTLSGDTMGTGWSVKLVGRPDLQLGSLEAAIGRVLDGVIAEMSGWNPDSDLVRFNTAPAGSWHELPDGFLAVLRTSLRIAEFTDGAFDPTLGSLVDLWGFGPSGPVAEPAASATAALREASGWRRVRLEGSRLLQPGALVLDLSGVAKGYAVDLVAAALMKAGLSSFLVEIGGELRGQGVKPDLSPWWTELEHPPGATGVPETLVALHGLSVATSGDYRRFRDAGGRRLAHTLDPRTGAPTGAEIASVSAIHESCMEADAWATALTVLGAEKGAAMAERHGLAAHFVLRTMDGFEEVCTSAFQRLAT